MATPNTIAIMAKQMGGQSIEQIVQSVSCAIIGHKCDTRETLETLKRNRPELFPFPENHNVYAQQADSQPRLGKTEASGERGGESRGKSTSRARPSRDGERGWQ